MALADATGSGAAPNSASARWSSDAIASISGGCCAAFCGELAACARAFGAAIAAGRHRVAIREFRKNLCKESRGEDAADCESGEVKEVSTSSLCAAIERGML